MCFSIALEPRTCLCSGPDASLTQLPNFSRLWVSQVELGVKNLSANTGDIRHMGSIPGSGRSPGEVNGNPLQYSCLENSMDRRVCWAVVHRLAKSQT